MVQGYRSGGCLTNSQFIKSFLVTESCAAPVDR